MNKIKIFNIGIIIVILLGIFGTFYYFKTSTNIKNTTSTEESLINSTNKTVDEEELKNNLGIKGEDTPDTNKLDNQASIQSGKKLTYNDKSDNIDFPSKLSKYLIQDLSEVQDNGVCIIYIWKNGTKSTKAMYDYLMKINENDVNAKMYIIKDTDKLQEDFNQLLNNNGIYASLPQTKDLFSIIMKDKSSFDYIYKTNDFSKLNSENIKNVVEKVRGDE